MSVRSKAAKHQYWGQVGCLLSGQTQTLSHSIPDIEHWMFIMVNMLLNACMNARALPVDSEAKSSSLQLLPVNRMTTWKE